LRDRNVTIRNLAVFTCVVWSIGWIAAAIQTRINDESAQQLGLLIWLVTPLATVLLLRAVAGDGWRDFGLAPAFSGNVPVYVAAVLFHPLGAVLVLLVGYGLGRVVFPEPSIGRLLGVVAAGLAPSLIKNVFEEFAWRGYLTPKVHSLRLNDYVGHGIVGLIWGGWHVPYFLFLVDPDALHAASNQDLATFIPMALLSLVAVSIVYGELRLMTDSVWPPLLAHTIGNALIDVLIARGFARIEPGAEYLLSPGYQSVLTIVFCVGAGVLLRRWRINRMR
jgi:membrane protease YdiL (CAAX protease family)